MIKLEVIVDYGSACTTYGNLIESKGVQVPSQDTPEKISGVVAHYTLKMCGFVL